MIIRKARIEDAPAITTYILLAMGDIIYQFIGEKDEAKAKGCMLHFVKQLGNQYSYTNCWVLEDKGEIIAAACVYDGAKISMLRAPVLAYLKNEFNRTLTVQDETGEGEFYLDCLGVDPSHQGKGAGSKMLLFLIEEYVKKQHLALGLLVDENNPEAKRLYLKLGFEVAGYKTFAGKKMEHLQLRS